MLIKFNGSQHTVNRQINFFRQIYSLFKKFAVIRYKLDNKVSSKSFHLDENEKYFLIAAINFLKREPLNQR